MEFVRLRYKNFTKFKYFLIYKNNFMCCGRNTSVLPGKLLPF